MKMQKDKYDFASMPTIEELSSYESPIQVVCREMQNTFDSDVMKAVLSYGISVDKDELIRALQYDRDQYGKGFADGLHVNLGEDVAPVVRCKDCEKEGRFDCPLAYIEKQTLCFVNHDADFFCADGERRSGE